MEIEVIDENCVDLQLQEEQLKLAKKKAKWNSIRPRFAGIVNALHKLGVEPKMSEYAVDICFSGDKEKLAAVMRILRTSGWKFTANRPKAGDSSWYAYFTHKDCDTQIWFSFTSSVCRRVQVGTKMQEVPIYETICGDDKPEVEICVPEVTLETESTSALTQTDIPF